MKAILLAALLISFNAAADTYVNGYTRADGTYVSGHFRTDSNDTKLDNYSTRGNVNPYTGNAGTVQPYQYNNNQYNPRNSNIQQPRNNNGW